MVPISVSAFCASLTIGQAPTARITISADVLILVESGDRKPGGGTSFAVQSPHGRLDLDVDRRKKWRCRFGR